MQAEGVSKRIRADWLPRAIISGFIAAVAMVFTFALAYGLAYVLAGVPLAEHKNTPVFRGWLYGLTHNSLTDLAGARIYEFAGLHFFVAIVWAVLYARFAEPELPGPGWVRGLSFSLLPWVISVGAVFPLTGAGFLGGQLGAGPFPFIGNLILHAAYGAALGAVYGPLGDIPADTFARRGPADDLETIRWGEVRTAMGIVAGLVIGLIASMATVALQGASASPAVGLPHAAIVFGWTLLGGAFGAFVGSFAGLAPPR